MEYQGFHSISEFERECARLGYKTRRVPFHKGDEKYFALIDSAPDASIEAWTLFTADETAIVLDGIISGGAFMHAGPMMIHGRMEPGYLDENGVDKNWLGKLAAHGYYPDIPEEAAIPAPAPAAPEYPAGAGGQICFLF